MTRPMLPLRGRRKISNEHAFRLSSDATKYDLVCASMTRPWYKCMTMHTLKLPRSFSSMSSQLVCVQILNLLSWASCFQPFWPFATEAPHESVSASILPSLPFWLPLVPGMCLVFAPSGKHSAKGLLIHYSPNWQNTRGWLNEKASFTDIDTFIVICRSQRLSFLRTTLSNS
jgi:hypothetical protein